MKKDKQYSHIPVHLEIPGVSLNFHDPLLGLTGVHPRQTGGIPIRQVLLIMQGMGASGLFGLPRSGKGWKKIGHTGLAGKASSVTLLAKVTYLTENIFQKEKLNHLD